MKLTCEIEFLLPEGVTNLAEVLLRLGIRVKQLAVDNAATVSPNPDQPLVRDYKDDLTVRHFSMVEVS